MAVKTEKNRKRSFCTITDLKPVPVEFKSVSIYTGPPSLLLKQKLIWLAVLSYSY